MTELTTLHSKPSNGSRKMLYWIVGLFCSSLVATLIVFLTWQARAIWDIHTIQTQVVIRQMAGATATIELRADLGKKIDELRNLVSTKMDDRYRKVDADRDWQARDRQLTEHGRRLDRLERQSK